MDIPKLKKALLQYVANEPQTGMLHEWQKTANILGIQKNELEYLVNEMGENYFDECKDGFFAKNKSIIEGKHEIKIENSSIITVTTINGDGNTVIQDSSLDKARISPTIDKPTNKSPHNPPKRSWLEILAWIIGIIAGMVAIYEFIIKK